MNEDFEKNVHIPELYDLNHRHDNNLNIGYDYRNNLLKDNLSKSIFKNDITNGFLLFLEKMFVLSVDSNVITRNWFNHTVSKYYNKYNN